MCIFFFQMVTKLSGNSFWRDWGRPFEEVTLEMKDKRFLGHSLHAC